MFSSISTEHPDEGLILFEIGAGKDCLEALGTPSNVFFARVNYETLFFNKLAPK